MGRGPGDDRGRRASLPLPQLQLWSARASGAVLHPHPTRLSALSGPRCQTSLPFKMSLQINKIDLLES